MSDAIVESAFHRNAIQLQIPPLRVIETLKDEESGAKTHRTPKHFVQNSIALFGFAQLSECARVLASLFRIAK